MRHFPDDMHSGLHLDPLERARLDLDFEALAASAPPVKEVLFKAQTMGPLPGETGPRLAPVLALAALIALLAVPWIPLGSSFTVMQVGFEQPIPRREADKLAAALLKGQPPGVLVGTEFTPQDHRMGYNINGQLRINLTAFNIDEKALQESYREQIARSVGPGREPMFRVSYSARDSRRLSPMQLIARALAPRPEPQLHLPGLSRQLARQVEQSTPLLAGALQPELQKLDGNYRVLGAGLVGQQDNSADFDFTVPAWPQPLGFKVENFGSLTAAQQNAIRGEAQAFIAASNLAAGAPPAPADDASAPPITVRVNGADGRYDPRLSAQVQARVEQPDEARLRSVSFSPRGAVEQAVADYLPEVAYRADYETVVSGVRRYVVTITLLPGRVDSAEADPAAALAVEGDEAIVDW